MKKQKRFLGLLIVLVMSISISACAVQDINTNVDSSVTDNDVLIEATSEETTEYSKYPQSLTSYNLAEIGDFVVLNDHNDKYYYDGYDYLFASLVVFSYSFRNMSDVEVYSVSGSDIIAKYSNLEVFATESMLITNDQIFNTYNGWGERVTFTITDYDNTNGTFHLKRGNDEVLCVPYDSIDWNNCYMTGDVTNKYNNDDAAVAVLK